MRALHLFSNHKFTGPADPAMILCQALRERGIDVVFAPSREARDRDLGRIARGRGLPLDDSFELLRHGRPGPLLRDARALARSLRGRPVDVVHAHLANDHLVATLATRRLGIPVVRTLYDGRPPSGLRARYAFSRAACVFTFAPAVAQRVRAAFPGPAVEMIDPVVDFAHLDAAEPVAPAEWKAGPDALVVGVVARMQTHRLFPALIEGFARAARDDAGLRLVILGRGTNQQTVAVQPAARSGVADRIFFPGYVPYERYPGYVAGFGALVFLVPGSDGTCRAAREALGLGVPVIASRRGLLPEFVRDGENGLLLPDESADAIAAAIRRLRGDPALRRRLSDAARRDARERFAPSRQAAQVAAVYERLAAPLAAARPEA